LSPTHKSQVWFCTALVVKAEERAGEDAKTLFFAFVLDFYMAQVYSAPQQRPAVGVASTSGL